MERLTDHKEHPDTPLRRRFSLFHRSSSNQRPRLNFLRRSAPADLEKGVCESTSSTSTSPLHQQTTIVVEEQPREETCAARIDDDEALEQAFIRPTSTCESATAILQHSYLFCAASPTRDTPSRMRANLPEDPTVQESIECIFASQLKEGLPAHLLDDDDDEDDDDYRLQSYPVAPSSLQQSILKNRALPRRRRSFPQQWPHHRHSSLVHVGTFDPLAGRSSPKDVGPSQQLQEQQRLALATKSTCFCHHQTAPLLPPCDWPQRPLLLRPSQGTTVKGVRFSSSADYLWEPSSTTPWPVALHHHWQEQGKSPAHVTMQIPQCAQCCILPINNGNEPPGEALVVDFATEMFDGTLLLRIRHSAGTTAEPYRDDTGYFAGMNRRYQAVVRGHFKSTFPLTDCLTGFRLERPCGRLPAKFVVKSALKVVSFFAPQLQCQLDGPRPFSLTPLGSTPQTVVVGEDGDIEALLEEPVEASFTLLGQSSPHSSAMQRARYRKRTFDKLFQQQSSFPQAYPDKTYTFEFLQHMFNFDDFSVELGPIMGSIRLDEVLNGQPLSIMAEHGSKKLWGFDIWHESLYLDAQRYDAEMAKGC